MHPDAVDAKRLAQALARELPEAAHLPAVRDTINNTTSATSSTTTTTATSISTARESSLQSLLDLAAELVLDAQLTVRVARAARPLLLDVVARALSGVRNGTLPTRAASGSQDTNGSSDASAGPQRAAAVVMPVAVEQAERVLVVMSRLLPAAPHCLSLALHHWRCSVCPLECLRVRTQPSAGAASAEATEEGRLLEGERGMPWVLC